MRVRSLGSRFLSFRVPGVGFRPNMSVSTHKDLGLGVQGASLGFADLPVGFGSWGVAKDYVMWGADVQGCVGLCRIMQGCVGLCSVL